MTFSSAAVELQKIRHNVKPLTVSRFFLAKPDQDA